MKSIEITLLTPGGRQEKEFQSFENFLELLTDCSESREVIESAIESGVFPVNEIEYRFLSTPEFKEFVFPRLSGLPTPDPSRPYSADACVAVTFPYQTSSAEGMEQLRPSQGLSFHRQDLGQANRSIRGLGRGLLERPLWEKLLAFPAELGTAYSGFHLGARIDRYGVRLEGPSINAILPLIAKSAYRPAREMLDYLSYHRPQEMRLVYSCERK